jgi:hypothetical protein
MWRKKLVREEVETKFMWCFRFPAVSWVPRRAGTERENASVYPSQRIVRGTLRFVNVLNL